MPGFITWNRKRVLQTVLVPRETYFTKNSSHETSLEKAVQISAVNLIECEQYNPRTYQSSFVLYAPSWNLTNTVGPLSF